MPRMKRRNVSSRVNRAAKRRKVNYRRRPRRGFRPSNSRIRRVVANMAETKTAMRQITNNLSLKHNEFVSFTQNLLYTDDGIAGEQVGTGSSGSRVGSKIFLKGVDFRMYFENYQTRPQIQYRVILFRPKVPTATAQSVATLCEGAHTNKLLDYLRTESFEIIYVWNFTVNHPTGQGTLETANSDGTYNVRENVTEVDERVLTRGGKMIKKYMKFNKWIHYPDVIDSTVPTTDQWHMGVIAYDNYNTPTTQESLAYATVTAKLYFKDL